MLTQTERVRRFLSKSFDAPAADVQDALSKKSVEISTGLVHQVRSVMRKEQQQIEADKQTMVQKMLKTCSLNDRPLREHVYDLVNETTDGLTSTEIETGVLATYKLGESSSTFGINVRKKLNLLVRKKRITLRNGKYYPYVKKEKPVCGNCKGTGVYTSFTGQEPCAVCSPVEQPRESVAAMVAKLKAIVAKLGKQETKDLIEVI